jgi:hypothetical protein
MTRGWVCNLLWALPTHLLSGTSPAELMIIFYCLISDFLNLEGLVPVFISPRDRVAQIYPRALGSLFVASYDSTIFYCPPTWSDRPPYLYPPGIWCPSYTPRALGSLSVASYDSQGYGGGIVTRLHTGLKPKVNLSITST